MPSPAVAGGDVHIKDRARVGRAEGDFGDRLVGEKGACGAFYDVLFLRPVSENFLAAFRPRADPMAQHRILRLRRQRAYPKLA